MDFNIYDVKKWARSHLGRAYFTTILVGIIFVILDYIFEGILATFAKTLNIVFFMKEFETFTGVGAFGFIYNYIIVSFIISIIIKIFITNPLNISKSAYYIETIKDVPKLQYVGYGFKNNYIKNVKLILYRDIIIFLWSLLLIIPGIIKRYEYILASYLIVENKELEVGEALNLSKKMMLNNKSKAFLLELSFIGWEILSKFTFGLVGFFYSRPYLEFSRAQMYYEIRRAYYAKNNMAS